MQTQGRMIPDRVAGNEAKKNKKPKKAKSLLRRYNVTPETDEGTSTVFKTGPDGLFLVLALLLQVLGIIMCFSASSVYSVQMNGSSFGFLLSQLKYVGIGVFVILIEVIVLTPQRMKLIAPLFYGGAILLLIAVLLMGFTGGGAQRWIQIGSFSVQPSEIAKTGLILLLSLYMSRFDNEINLGPFNKKKVIHGLLVPGCMVGLVLVLVLFEKHFSGLIIISVISVVMMFMGGANFPILGGACLGAGGILAYLILFTGYSSSRIDSWLHRGADALGSDWQSTQGLYAIGTGGLFGLGIGQSRLKYGYVSQPQNDFVFTVVCEELGFFGALAILVLFLALVGRGFVLATRASDKFCSMVIFGLSFKLAVHVLFNVAVVTGLFPNTGISFPFFSSGGSATIMQLSDIGMILALSRYSTQKR
ncbi:MAG: FtsW/RodA/SpoVE family cell cycle protein [Clostridia bacterium]|nr:FtsW/RodA/SpoVE family cell cycle protein [Clostridia bacterium]